jgi:hypothetical protein
MPLAPVLRETVSDQPSGAATGTIQRAETPSAETPGSGSAGGAINYDKLAEEVWPRLRRKLRVERERERGLPS